MIRFQLVRGKGVSSKLIAWWGTGWNGYSHVDCLMADGSLIGARDDRLRMPSGRLVPPGIQVREPGYEVWDRRTVYTLVALQPVTDQWELYVRSHVGEKYDEQDILDLLLGRKPVDHGRRICSAFATDSLQAVGVWPSVLSHPSLQTTPDTLAFGLSVGGALATEMPV